MKTRNQNIQIVRIVAMFSILLCHFFNEIGNSLTALGQFFNVGVFIFFIISAYLYGKKEITDSKKWIIRKLKQIVIPIYIWLVIVNIIYLLTQSNVNYMDNIFYIFCIQAFVGSSLTGLAHLWFITLILIMYLITPLLSKSKDKISKHLIPLNMLFLVCFIAISYIRIDIGRYLFYIILYINTFIYSYNEQLTKRNSNNNKLKNIGMITAILGAGVARIVLRKFFDGTVFYGNFIVLPTQTIIALCIFELILNLKIKFNRTKLIDYFDGVSYYVYIVHYIFCVGPLKVIYPLSIWYPLQVLSTVIISIIIGTMLKLITDKINKLI